MEFEIKSGMILIPKDGESAAEVICKVKDNMWRISVDGNFSINLTTKEINEKFSV